MSLQELEIQFLLEEQVDPRIWEAAQIHQQINHVVILTTYGFHCLACGPFAITGGATE